MTLFMAALQRLQGYAPIIALMTPRYILMSSLEAFMTRSYLLMNSSEALMTLRYLLKGSC